LLIQQKFYGDLVFNRSWAEYKAGFNDLRGNYWLGNDLLSQLTMTGRYKLRFDLQPRSTRRWYYAEYSTFIIHPEPSYYRLQVSGYSGNVGYNAFGVHNGMNFSTFDRDNDHSSTRHCATEFSGGSWFSDCGHWCANCYNFWWNNLPGRHPLQTNRMWLQCK